MAVFKKDILVTGYSGGAGKSFLINQKIIPLAPETLVSPISHTTRSPRGTDKHGKEYYFTELRVMEEMISQKCFLEYTKPAPGIYYGSSIAEYEKAKSREKFLVYDVDYRGFEQLTQQRQHRLNKFVTVLLLTPVWQRILWMKKRGDMTDEKMLDRLLYSDMVERAFFEKNRNNFTLVLDEYSEERNCDIFANEIVNMACI